MKVLSVVGARPNYMKVAPLHRALESHGAFASRILHTGQHYGERMNDVFFRQLGLPEPHVYLDVGSDNHARQTAAIMVAFDDALDTETPDLVVVVGDVNSTLACSLVAAKRHVPVAHIEAGLRSGDMKMPEEVNRVLTDRLSSLLFVTEESGRINLLREGVPEERIHLVGNLMIDTLVRLRERAGRSRILDDLGVGSGSYVLMTMHRPSNVDRDVNLAALLELLRGLTESSTVIFPIHPRTRSRFEESGRIDDLNRIPRLRLVEPLGYLEFLRLMEAAAVVITDSGGIQEETTYLGVPCITLRSTTERPVTVTAGTNELMDLVPERVVARVAELARGGSPNGTLPPLWDGEAAERVVGVLARELGGSPS
jgi:UDP-N-acetylglucosamine 2-epimerase (non-hydrolysing)